MDAKRVIEAEEIRIVDGEGNVRASLDATDGIPVLVLLDSKGAARAVLSLCGHCERPALHFLGEDGKPNGLLGVGEDDAMAMSIHDEEHERRLSLSLDDDSPLAVRSRNGEVESSSPVVTSDMLEESVA